MKKKKSNTPKPSPTKSSNDQLEQTLGGELRKLKIEAGKAHQRYSSEKDPLLAAAHLSSWLKLSAAVSSMARVAAKTDLEEKSVLSIADVEATWTRAFQEFRAELENLGRRVSTHALFTTAKLDPVDIEEILKVETDVTLNHLHNAGYIKR